jgi:hypothetical protein
MLRAASMQAYKGSVSENAIRAGFPTAEALSKNLKTISLLK